MTEITEPPVYIIVLSWNHCEDVLRCLHSVEAISYTHYQGVLVDNASSDRTVDAVRSTFPNWTVIVNDENLGFAAGCNVGLHYALEQQAEFVLLLNQDVIVSPDLLKILVKAAADRPGAGIFGPKTYTLQSITGDQPRLLYTGAWRRYLPLQQHIPGIEQVDRGLYETPKEVDYVWGHGMFIRTTLLKEIGFFDTAYVFYYEDIDLCRRASDAGYELWYIADALLWHDAEDGARSSDSDLWRWQYKALGMNIFYHKHYGQLLGTLLLMLTVLDMSMHMLVHRKHKAARQLLLSWFHLWTGQHRMAVSQNTDSTRMMVKRR
jgi:GT2 family glycosyltransferase